MYKNLKVKYKLTLSFSVIMIFFLIILFISISAITAIEDKIYSFYYIEHENSLTQMEIRKNIEKLDKEILMMVNNSNETNRQDYKEEVDKSIELVMKDINTLKKNFRDQTIMKELNTCMNKVIEQEMMVMSYSLKGSKAEAFTLLNSDYAQASEKLHKVLDEVGAVSDKSVTDAFKEIIMLKNYAAAIILVTAIICLSISILFVKLLTDSIVKPIRQIVCASNDISQGNLSDKLIADSKDELGEVIQAFANMSNVLKGIIAHLNYTLNEMARGNFSENISYGEKYMGNFQEIFSAVKNLNENINLTLIPINLASNQVKSNSDQLFNDSQAVAGGAMEQAAAIQELSATILDIKAQIEKTAENSQTANLFTKEVSTNIIQSDGYMKDMVNAISDISSRSKEVMKIIKTIDDIAFQTNILALNAAVEAARAGLAGKGFSVVADEVRKLAQKSAAAAQSTTELIKSSIDAIDHGTNIAGETEKALKNVVEKSSQAADLIHKISVASVQQTDSIQQLSAGIEQITSVVQINSETAEQSASISKELNHQARILKEKISGFKLQESC
ncbi:methyl-accepting chemotaxis protein [Aminipila sp.]|uniref:methyl-accepting chemotaxis protein n=1 Tax=Aminipila sp. TaxID=2060095 RepID=UPI00289FC4C5|nr:methyl-accepting chemotaxis protein [Aminipila sp.]